VSSFWYLVDTKLNSEYSVLRGLLLAVVVSNLWFPAIADDKPASDDGHLFYPLPPDEPRFQYLASFSSALDVSAGKKGFRDFVFGGQENEGHLVTKPYGVALHDGVIHVVDTRGSGWGVFDLKSRRSYMVRPTGGGTLKKPINISIDTDGTTYVTDTGREQVLVFDSKNRFLKAFGEPGQFKPVDVAIADNRLYVSDISNNQVVVLDKQSGSTLHTFGETGSAKGQLFQPTNLAVAADGSVYVVDTGNFRVQQFSADGDFIRVMGGIGAGPGTFSRPKGIALDEAGYVYVIDAAFENIQVFHPDGGALMFFGKPGIERDNINLPTVVKIDYENVRYFEQYAAPDFDIEYLVVVASQFGVNKVVVFGYGSLRE
jgi:DNA-binding beta-propeller fold protein YncE